MRSNKRINPTRRSARLPWNRSARGLCATTLGVLIGTVFELRRLMVIEITRVPTRFWSARRYMLRLTPPDAEENWESPAAMSRVRLQGLLHDQGHHSTDIWDWILAADAA